MGWGGAEVKWVRSFGKGGEVSEAAKPRHWPGTRNNVWQSTRGGAPPGCPAWPGAGSAADLWPRVPALAPR